MRQFFLLASLALVLTSLTAGVARAQDRDVRQLMERMDRMERDMNMLQRQVYRGNSAGGPVPVSPAEPSTAVNAELRLEQLEAQMRDLTGRVEEVTYGLTQLKQRLEKLVGDVDFRFRELEKSSQTAAAEPPGTEASKDSRTTVGEPAAPTASTTSAPKADSQAAALGNPAAGQDNGPVGPKGGAQAATANGTLPSGSSQEQYNYAFGLLRQADYPAAEKALRAFVERYPNDPLAANAQYWLGETYYVRGDYTDAATAFAEGYRKYPKSGKGPDSLLKLGMSLGNAGQKKDACVTLEQLERQYPKASPNIVERTRSERDRLGCGKQN